MPFKLFVLLAGAARVSPWKFGAAVADRPRHPLLRTGLSGRAVRRARRRPSSRSTAAKSASASPLTAVAIGVVLLLSTASGAARHRRNDAVATSRRSRASSASRAPTIRTSSSASTPTALYLSDDEAGADQSLSSTARRARFLVGRALARTMLSRYAAVRAARLAVPDRRARPARARVHAPPGAPICASTSATPPAWSRARSRSAAKSASTSSTPAGGCSTTCPSASSRRAKSPTCAPARRGPGRRVLRLLDAEGVVHQGARARAGAAAPPLLVPPARAHVPRSRSRPELHDNPATWQFAQFWPTDDHRMAVAVRRSGDDLPIEVEDIGARGAGA